MGLTAGTRFGAYEVISLIATGGMGEVYRARDTRLQRDVAIKTLPAEFTSDPERLSRFQCEAQLLASLNHTNIAGIYGVEEGNGIRCLILELVEGETLRERLSRGPLPAEDVIDLGQQPPTAWKRRMSAASFIVISSRPISKSLRTAR